MPLAMEAQSLNHWTVGKVLKPILNITYSFIFSFHTLFNSVSLLFTSFTFMFKSEMELSFSYFVVYSFIFKTEYHWL